jgi:hypothetical protein
MDILLGKLGILGFCAFLIFPVNVNKHEYFLNRMVQDVKLYLFALGRVHNIFWEGT